LGENIIIDSFWGFHNFIKKASTSFAAAAKAVVLSSSTYPLSCTTIISRALNIQGAG